MPFLQDQQRKPIEKIIGYDTLQTNNCQTVKTSNDSAKSTDNISNQLSQWPYLTIIPRHSGKTHCACTIPAKTCTAIPHQLQTLKTLGL